MLGSLFAKLASIHQTYRRPIHASNAKEEVLR